MTLDARVHFVINVHIQEKSSVKLKRKRNLLKYKGLNNINLLLVFSGVQLHAYLDTHRVIEGWVLHLRCADDTVM